MDPPGNERARMMSCWKVKESEKDSAEKLNGGTLILLPSGRSASLLFIIRSVPFLPRLQRDQLFLKECFWSEGKPVDIQKAKHRDLRLATFDL